METRSKKKKTECPIENIEENEIIVSPEKNDDEYWKKIRKYAEEGKFELIPARIFVVYYIQIREIHNDYLKKHIMEFNFLNK